MLRSKFISIQQCDDPQTKQSKRSQNMYVLVCVYIKHIYSSDSLKNNNKAFGTDNITMIAKSCRGKDMDHCWGWLNSSKLTLVAWLYLSKPIELFPNEGWTLAKLPSLSRHRSFYRENCLGRWESWRSFSAYGAILLPLFAHLFTLEGLTRGAQKSFQGHTQP